jgi:hypothetical protein
VGQDAASERHHCRNTNVGSKPAGRTNNFVVKRTTIIGLTIIFGLIFSFYYYVIRDQQKLYATVKTDFADKYPNYQFVDCVVGEGDIVVAYVHVRFKETVDGKVKEEVWQYWDTDSVWLHKDKYLEQTKNKKE